MSQRVTIVRKLAMAVDMDKDTDMDMDMDISMYYALLYRPYLVIPWHLS